MKKYIIVLLIIFTFSKSSFAQVAPVLGTKIDLNRQLKLMGRAPINLDQFKDKLLIIDFFTTFCTSCIEAIPEHNLVQQEYKDEIQIVPVTIEKEDRVASFFRKNDYVKANELPIGIEDKDLGSIFPYQTVSHVVWIYKGKLIAITMGDMVTKNNIEHVLQGNSVANWPMKNDFFKSIDDTLVTHENVFESKLGSFVNGGTTSYRLDTIGDKIRLKIVNAPIIASFNYLFNEISKLPLMKKERIVVEAPNVERYIKPDTMPMSVWLQKYSFCYESTWPLTMDKSELYNAIIIDLSNRLGVIARLDDHDATVWVVRKSRNRMLNSVSNNGKKTELVVWMMMLEIFNVDFPPILIEEDQHTLIIPGAVKDFNSLRKVLESSGFDLSVEKKSILSLILKGK
ncbi:TlpA family protein disulfide reductase [Sphingobacterium sp. SG20118]|uniref:TlpA family protein disulfide reductase n=1 Tax=Sphingobacterium sp. SG20118 TaxID=3367156 RepID=UPI0037DFC1DB